MKINMAWRQLASQNTRIAVSLARKINGEKRNRQWRGVKMASAHGVARRGAAPGVA